MRKVLLVGTSADAVALAEALAIQLLPPDIAIVGACTQASTSAGRHIVTALAHVGVAPRDTAVASIGAVNHGPLHAIIGLDPQALQATSLQAERGAIEWSLPNHAIDSVAAACALRDAIIARLGVLAQTLALSPAIGIIGGSGFYDMAGLSTVEEFEVATPYGPPSGPLTVGMIGAQRVVFLPRHGKGHRLLPSEVNMRANIYALKRAGVTRLISISAVGSLRETIAPGHVVLPHQFIDRTAGRPSTYFGNGVVAHVSMADPVCADLRGSLAAAATATGAAVHHEGTYICIEGPQFSTRAESHMFRQWGADVVGMTNLPEARLAREAELCYATLVLPTDYDSWRPHDEVRVADVLSTLMANVAKAKAIVAQALPTLRTTAGCSCQHTLDTSLLTAPAAIEPAAAVRLHAIVARALARGAA